jgi:thioredoxin
MEITSSELKQKMKNGEKFIVDFWAPWCGPCRVMKPMFEKAGQVLKEDTSNVSCYTFNIENDKDFAINEMGVRSVPTIKAFVGDKEVHRSTGVMRTEQIVDIAKVL